MFRVQTQRRYQMSTVYLCAINNVLSGACNEDCAFCTQSIKHHADIERHNYKQIEQIVSEAKVAKSFGAFGYCLVTSGKGLDDKKTEFIAKVARAIKQDISDIHLIGCNGIADQDQLRYLKKNGIDSYNHNLETSPWYYEKICTTHSWDERYQTCENVKLAGLALCSGGIFGMEEDAEDRDELIRAIASLEPNSVPINFFISNKALPIKSSNLAQDEALSIIKETRKTLGKESIIMIAGGRELMFGGNEREMFGAGANAIVIGDYLTTKGEDALKDIQMIKDLGFKIGIKC
ncbi:MAG: biotin synthase [Campylobacterales bacterium]|nr:biotin synthase [Campylobacterales bacterium]